MSLSLEIPNKWPSSSAKSVVKSGLS